MCLAIPAKVLSLEGNGTAAIALGGLTREASLVLVPDAGVGDYVLVHAGYAIQKIDQAEAEETLKLLAQIAEMAPSGAD